MACWEMSSESGTGNQGRFFPVRYLNSLCNQRTFKWYSVHQAVLLKTIISSVSELFLFQIHFALINIHD